MRLKNDTNNYTASFNITPPYQMLVLHSKVLIYPREIYQRGVERKRVELIARDFNEYIVNEPKVSFRNGKHRHSLSRQHPQMLTVCFSNRHDPFQPGRSR